MKTSMKEPSKATDKTDGESDVLALIAAMPESDRVIGERLHAIIKASALALLPRSWYGMPAYAKDGKVVASSKVQISSTRGSLRLVSSMRRILTKAIFGRLPSL